MLLVTSIWAAPWIWEKTKVIFLEISTSVLTWRAMMAKKWMSRSNKTSNIAWYPEAKEGPMDRVGSGRSFWWCSGLYCLLLPDHRACIALWGWYHSFHTHITSDDSSHKRAQTHTHIRNTKHQRIYLLYIPRVPRKCSYARYCDWWLPFNNSFMFSRWGLNWTSQKDE